MKINIKVRHGQYRIDGRLRNGRHILGGGRTIADAFHSFGTLIDTMIDEGELEFNTVDLGKTSNDSSIKQVLILHHQ